MSWHLDEVREGAARICTAGLTYAEAEANLLAAATAARSAGAKVRRLQVVLDEPGGATTVLEIEEE